MQYIGSTWRDLVEDTNDLFHFAFLASFNWLQFLLRRRISKKRKYFKLLNRNFHKLDGIGNIGMRPFTMWKTKIPTTKC